MAVPSIIRRWWEKFWGAVDDVEAESATDMARHRAAGRAHWGVVGVVVVGSICLSVLEYYGSSSDYKTLNIFLAPFFENEKELKAFMRGIFRKGERAELYRLTYWSAMTFLFYFLLPAAFVKLVLREKLADYGLRVRGVLKHWWIYLAMFLVVLPFVVAVAFTEPFQRTYPFYGNAGNSLFDFTAWTLIYSAQFFSLEFFFRGFLIHGTRARFGFYAILLSVVPYCMIHFGKPLPETIGAIIAGLALGAVSMFTRSIWLGVAIHVSVAVSMDILSLAIQGKLF